MEEYPTSDEVIYVSIIHSYFMLYFVYGKYVSEATSTRLAGCVAEVAALATFHCFSLLRTVRTQLHPNTTVPVAVYVSSRKAAL